jgi:membrane protein implicated in regulation of membrane protease activity
MILGLDAWIFWLILAAVFVLVEILTINLVSVWFAAGALAAMVASFVGASVILQAIIAVAVAGIVISLVVIFKPFDKFKKKETEPTNFDRIIGQTGIVLEQIDPILGKGTVKVMGQVWSAIPEGEYHIKEGTEITVLSVSGVKIVVKPINQNE